MMLLDGLMAKTLMREFPFGFKGNIALLCDYGGTGMPFVLKRTIHLFAEEAEAMNIVLKLDKFRFLLSSSSAMGFGGLLEFFWLQPSNDYLF